MIQLITDLPFDLSTSLDALKKDWTRFQDGLVTLNEISDAIRGVFDCEAEIIAQDQDQDEDSSESVTVTVNDDSTEVIDRNNPPTTVSLDIVPSGNGKLILTASKLYWIKSELTSPPNSTSDSTSDSSGWSIDYKNVLLHAISKPTESRPYLYLQLSCNKILDHNGNEIDFPSDNADEEDEEKFVEVNLVVKDNDVADEMFVALSECASLHPCDESESQEEDDDECDSHDDSDNKKCKIDQERFEDAAEN